MVLLLLLVGLVSASTHHSASIRGSIVASVLHAMGVAADPALQARIVNLSKQIEDLQKMVNMLIPEQQETLAALQREQQAQQKRDEEAKEAQRVEEERRRQEEEAKKREEERLREEEKAKELELIRELELQKKKLEMELIQPPSQQAEEARRKAEEDRLAAEEEERRKQEEAEVSGGVCSNGVVGDCDDDGGISTTNLDNIPQSALIQEELEGVVRGLQKDSDRLHGDMKSWELFKDKEIRRVNRKSQNAAKVLRDAKDSEGNAKHEKEITAAISAELVARLAILERENQELRTSLESLQNSLEKKLLDLDEEVDELTKRVDADDAEEEALGGSAGAISGAGVQNMIEKALDRFAADRVGMPDYALESSGGIVFTIGETEPYTKDTPWMGVFGISIWKSCKTPRLAIQADNSPGNCWSFYGDRGTLTIQLSAQVFPEYFTLDHIPLDLAPGKNASSAPKHFRVLGLDYGNAPKGHVLGNYEFTKFPIETFAVQQNPYEKYFRFIKIEVLSNYGNKDYTCLYRFRVHGKPYDIDTYNG